MPTVLTPKSADHFRSTEFLRFIEADDISGSVYYYITHPETCVSYLQGVITNGGALLLSKPTIKGTRADLIRRALFRALGIKLKKS